MNKYINKQLTISALLVYFLTCNTTLAQSNPGCQLPQFGTIIVDSDIEVNGAGQNVDTIEFWKSPDSTETLMFVSAKDNELVEVWKYPFEGNEQPPLTHSTFNNSQVNGLAIDQETDLLYVAIGEPSSTVSVFSLPILEFQMNFSKQGADYQSEPNLTILNLPNGDKNIYVSADFPVYIHSAVTGNFIDEFTPEQGLETMAADDFYQRIYIPDENNRTGIYVYNPDGTPYTNNGSNVFGGDGIFNSDAEGIIVYNCPLTNPVDNGEGFMIVSDQRSSQTEFEFFDRITWEHLGTMKITGVSNTDGIASYPYTLPDYPLGVFAALDDDNAVAIVGWDKIFEEIFPVPVELSSFKAVIIDGEVDLIWKTETELNNYGFNIEIRQLSAVKRDKSWRKIGFVPGYGTTTEPHIYSFIDKSVSSGIFQYRLKQIDYNGTFEYSDIVEVEIDLPTEFSLKQNYPNPFNPNTSIQYTVSSNQFVSLKVYDILGNEIVTLVNEEKPAGTYEVEFDATELTSGIYFYKLTAGPFIQTNKMVLLR